MEQHLGRKLGRYEIVHHINGDPQDNRLENLQVMSLSEHSSYHLSKPRKSRHPAKPRMPKTLSLKPKTSKNPLPKLCARKLTDEQVRLVRQLKQNGFGYIRISKHLGTNINAIRKIVNHKTYKDVI